MYEIDELIQMAEEALASAVSSWEECRIHHDGPEFMLHRMQTCAHVSQSASLLAMAKMFKDAKIEIKPE